MIGSSEFLNDSILRLMGQLTEERVLNNLQFMQNATDWSVEDLDLLTIRSRGTSARLLRPLEEAEQRRYELLNYAIALLALVGVGLIWYWRRRTEKPLPLPHPAE
ncbi:MAG: hypothetical protein KatS3mg115_2052 [Candidatus Poribacteria bacterium]|nr:MAG: hypothetical protein KatS3mg115_2052 [Candidatus Poribacteria bacterium]